LRNSPRAVIRHMESALKNGGLRRAVKSLKS
jgi:hypothetical protein